MLHGTLKFDKKGNLVLIAAETGAKRIVNFPTAREILSSLAEKYLIEVGGENGAIIRFKN